MEEEEVKRDEEVEMEEGSNYETLLNLLQFNNDLWSRLKEELKVVAKVDSRYVLKLKEYLQTQTHNCTTHIQKGEFIVDTSGVVSHVIDVNGGGFEEVFEWELGKVRQIKARNVKWDLNDTLTYNETTHMYNDADITQVSEERAYGLFFKGKYVKARNIVINATLNTMQHLGKMVQSLLTLRFYNTKCEKRKRIRVPLPVMEQSVLKLLQTLNIFIEKGKCKWTWSMGVKELAILTNTDMTRHDKNGDFAYTFDDCKCEYMHYSTYLYVYFKIQKLEFKRFDMKTEDLDFAMAIKESSNDSQVPSFDMKIEPKTHT